MKRQEIKSFTPPHPTAENYREEPESIVQHYSLLTHTRDWDLIHNIDVARNMGFIHHPSRETEALVEGALFQEDQNKLADAVRYKVADFCVKRGIWKSVGEAFEEREKLRRKHNPRPPNLL